MLSYYWVEKIQKVKIQKLQRQKPEIYCFYQIVREKKSKLIKEQEASRLSSSLGIKTYLSKIPLVGPVLF